MQEDCGPGLSAFIFVAWLAVDPPQQSEGEKQRSRANIADWIAVMKREQVQRVDLSQSTSASNIT
jgi:hypothetical protein